MLKTVCNEKSINITEDDEIVLEWDFIDGSVVNGNTQTIFTSFCSR